MTAWGPDWLRLIETPAGACEKSRPACGGSGRFVDGLAAARAAIECEGVAAAATDQRIVAGATFQGVGAA